MECYACAYTTNSKVIDWLLRRKKALILSIVLLVIAIDVVLANIKKLFRDLERRNCDVEVTSRKSVSEESVHSSLLIPASSLLSGLTEKQARALIAAIDNGYYNLPRNATAMEIARRLGVPRTSFVDHLRKAQNKLIRTIGPYVRLKPA